MKALLQGIINELTGTTLNTNIGGRFYLNEAPQNVAYPYVVYQIISEFPDEYFADTADLEEISITMDIFSEKASGVECNNLYENLKTAFDNCELTVSGYTHVSMTRVGAALIRDPSNNLWQYSVDYEVLLVG